MKLAGRGTLAVSIGLATAEAVEAQAEQDAGKGYADPVRVARVGVRIGTNLSGLVAGTLGGRLLAGLVCEGASAGFATIGCLAGISSLGAAAGASAGNEIADTYFDFIDAEPRFVLQ